MTETNHSEFRIPHSAFKGPILGIWGYSSDVPQVAHHDSGAALIAGGKVLAAVNEERITRRKNEGCWPERSIEEVLRLAGMEPREVAAVAMAGLEPLPRAAAMLKELGRTVIETREMLPNRWLYALLTAKKIKRRGPVNIAAPLVFVAHHDAHAASAYYTALFDDAAVVTLDGIGDSAHCGGIYAGSGGRLRRLRLFNGYASLGLLYSYVTKAFGFRPARHEGKITGLAAYGDSEVLIREFRARLRYENGQLHSDLVPKLFRNRVDAQWETSWIDEIMERHSREDIAAALQRHTEEVAVAIAADALRMTGAKNIALAGGVFANVRVNQRIREITPGAVWVHPNMGDAGLGLGAALFHAGARVPLPDVYLGGDVGGIAAESAFAASRPSVRPASVEKTIAAACAADLIVGHAAGRMEYGPRALGHRTIFASASDANINTTLNDRLHRTEFMPFAPIMTEAAARLYLTNWAPSDTCSRFMTMTYNVTEACRRDAPAIVHVDGTARPQVVSPDSGRLQGILVEYGRITGKEVLINTSFNIHEEPIVRSADDAVRSWKQGAVDVLVVGDTVHADAEVLAKIAR